MQTLTLWIPCTPPKATSQMKGMARCAGRVHFYKKDSVAMAERSFLVHLKGNMPPDWNKIESGPIQLDVSFVWPWRQTERKSNMEWPLLHMDVKPDCSNIIKLLEDCMTKVGVWRDDAQVADLRIRKFWGEAPGIRINVQPIIKYEDGAA